MCGKSSSDSGDPQCGQVDPLLRRQRLDEVLLAQEIDVSSGAAQRGHFMRHAR